MGRLAACFFGGAVGSLGFLFLGNWVFPPESPRMLIDSPAYLRGERQNAELRTELWSARVRLAEADDELARLRDAARREAIRVIPAGEDPADLIPPQNVPVPQP